MSDNLVPSGGGQLFSNTQTKLKISKNEELGFH